MPATARHGSRRLLSNKTLNGPPHSTRRTGNKAMILICKIKKI